MSSRRKSSTPCMIRVSDPMEQEDSEEMEVSTDNIAENVSSESLTDRDQTLVQDSIEDLGSEKVVAETDPSPGRRRPGGYACKYCPFSTQNLNDFKEHVDASHPNVILNPLYLCAVCNFSTKKFDSLTEHNETQHPGESDFKFKRVKINNQTVLEQTIEGRNNSVECVSADGQEGKSCAALPSKPTAVKIGKPKPNNIQSLYQGNDLENQLEKLIPKDQITAVNINGTVIIPELTMYQGLSHVMPLLQRPPNFNSVPKIAVPLNTTKYNPLLDNNTTLMTSFNRFPYPTHAELSWLTAASKHPEGQIKVWFTTQRLKQGITWSPEEVEEARKKMFNGSIPPVHQTFTVLPNPNPNPFTQPAKATQPFIQTTFGQSNLVLTSITNGSAVTCTPVAMTVASPVQAIKRPLTTPTFAPDLKRPMASPAEDPSEKQLMAPPPVPPKERLPMAPPPVPPEIKRSVALPLIAEMKRSSAAPLTASKGKLPTATAPVMPKSKLPMAPSPVFPVMKRSLAPPIVAPQFKNYMLSPSSIVSEDKLPITHSLLAPELKLPISPPLIAPQIRRPTIIQSVRTPLKVPSQVPSFPSDCRKIKEQTAELKPGYVRGRLLQDKVLTPLGEANGVHDQGVHTHNGIIQLYGSTLSPKHEQQKSVPTQFPLLERMKGKTSEQLKILEENFQRNSFPTYNDVDNLVTATRLLREEIDSWFLERRALRDDLEQALLNSMGSKRLDAERLLQNGPLNGQGGHPRSSPLPIIAPPTCSVPLDSKSLGLLKDVFAQTPWPSPEEYNHLEAQTGLARTEIVRWFKDNRLALKSGTLEWMELFHKLNSSGQNGQGALLSTQNAFSIIQRCQEGKVPKVEDIGRLTEQTSPNSQEMKDWFANKFRQTTSDMKNGGQNGGLKEGFGSLMEETKRMDAQMGAQELVSDTDKVMEDASGRVTG